MGYLEFGVGGGRILFIRSIKNPAARKVLNLFIFVEMSQVKTICFINFLVSIGS